MMRMHRGSSRRSAFAWWAALALESALVFFASSRPVPAAAFAVVPGADKIVHAAIHAVWSLLLLGALDRTWPELGPWRAGALSVLAATLHGLSDELHQSFVPGRTADWLDLLADLAGALAGVSVYVGWRRRGRGAGSATGVNTPARSASNG